MQSDCTFINLTWPVHGALAPEPDNANKRDFIEIKTASDTKSHDESSSTLELSLLGAEPRGWQWAARKQRWMNQIKV